MLLKNVDSTLVPEFSFRHSRSQAPAWERIASEAQSFGSYYEKQGLLVNYVPKLGLGNEKKITPPK